MAAEKKIPEIRFKGFEGEWEEKKLNEICTYHTSSLSIGDAISDGGYELYDANNVIGYTNSNVQPCDYITIIKDGSGVGRVRLMPKNTSFIGTMGALRSNNSDIHFLFCKLQKTDFTKHITGATIPHVYFSNYGQELCNTPTLPEQTQIGTYFQNLDSLISLHQRKYDKLLTVKKAMLEKMFPKEGADVPEIRFKGFEGKWEKKKLGEIGDLKNGMNFGKESMGFGHPFVNLQNVFGKNIVDNSNLGLAVSSDNQRKEYNLLKGDILFIRSSVKPDGVGEAAVIIQNMDNTTYSGFIIRFRPLIQMNNNFNRFIFSTSKIRKQIITSATSSANTNINQDSLKKIEILLPKIDEQTKIGTYFKNIDDLITQHHKQLEKLKNIKKACLEKMFV